MLEVTKSSNYIVSTYDVGMVVGSGETEEGALRDYIESANKLIQKTEVELQKLKDNVVEAILILENNN